MDYTNYDLSGGRRGRTKPPRQQPTATIAGVDAEYRGIVVPGRPHNHGLASPEPSSGWRWFWKHNGWVPVLGILGVVAFVLYVIWISLAGWEVASLPTFLLMGVGLFWLVYVIVSLCRPHMRVRFRKFSMIYVTAPFALWGLGCLIYLPFNTFG